MTYKKQNCIHGSFLGPAISYAQFELWRSYNYNPALKYVILWASVLEILINVWNVKIYIIKHAMPCIGWTNINISFVFEVGVLLEDRSKVERANMVGAPMEQVEPII